MMQRSGIDKSSTTPNPGYQWESNKLTVRHHKREPRGQPFPIRHPNALGAIKLLQYAIYYLNVLTFIMLETSTTMLIQLNNCLMMYL